MNRSFISVILGGFGVEEGTSIDKDKNRTVKTGSPEDAAFIMSNASSVIIVPGYGMAVAQAQHALREMCDILKKWSNNKIRNTSCCWKNARSHECFAC